ncbi:MAG TPA: hypothetical protein PLS67_05550 [Accumulibacter sp.]|jgi:hypothetical protein|nr:hypothetical protein [Accumulibacter sp.]HQC79971.1 hypothetical protein [Accumulibacter sp.]
MARRWLERDAGKHHIWPDHKMRLAAHRWARGHRALAVDQLED